MPDKGQINPLMRSMAISHLQHDVMYVYTYVTPDEKERGKLKWLLLPFHQIWCVGHVVRMGENRIHKQLFYGELKTGKCPQQKSRKMNVLHTNVQHWEELSLNCAEWWHREGCNIFDNEMNVTSMYRSCVTSELICQLICSLGNVVCVSVCCCWWQVM